MAIKVGTRENLATAKVGRGNWDCAFCEMLSLVIQASANFTAERQCKERKGERRTRM